MRFETKLFVVALAAVAACKSPSIAAGPSPAAAPAAVRATPSSADARVGLKAGMFDAAEATSNLRVLSKTKSPEGFNGITNSDITFTGVYAVQGNYHGFQIWDMSNPASPTLATAYTCPASQNDVSVYKQKLLFMSAEAQSGRLDCGTQGIPATDSVSKDRIRGVRIFDITDIRNPKYITSVQTCRGSHTHTLVEDPRDAENIYLYISGSSQVRSPSEMAGCVRETPDKDPNSSLFKIEVIKVPVAHPEQSAIISRSPFLMDLAAITSHGEAPEDKTIRLANVARAKAAGGFTAVNPANGLENVFNPAAANVLLDSIAKARGAAAIPAPAGAPAPGGFNAPPRPTFAQNAADTAALRAALPRLLAAQAAAQAALPRTGPNQCHDITVYPSLGIAGGACGGYGILLDIKDPANPKRIAAVADSNFAYWHSATFNNDGTKLLFSDEWGGGGSPKCRATDPKEWGADALFDIVDNNRMVFRSYYKLTAPQTALENCVAHNGSLIPVPGRDIMVQGWYQGGISVFDWTDTANPKEIAFFDRGPSDSTRQGPGGVWSVYWYNGYMISSEIARGLDITDLTPSQFLSENEINAAKSIKYEYFNAQDQPHFKWPPSFAVACSYVDQLERSNGLPAARIASIRSSLASAEQSSGDQRRTALTTLATQLNSDAAGSSDAGRVRKLSDAVSELVNAQSAVGCARKIS